MWEIGYLDNFGVLHVRFTGQLDFKLVEELSREILSELTERGMYRTLIDLSKMTPQLSNAEILKLPATLDALGMRRTSKVALISPSDLKHAKSINLFSRLVSKRGFMLRVLGNSDEALAWLSGITQCSQFPGTAAHYSSQCFDGMLSPRAFVRTDT